MAIQRIPKIKWDENLSVNIIKIDYGHKLIIGYINCLFDSMMAQTTEKTEEELFKSILDFIPEHFLNEEVEMYRHRYPDRAEHREIHDRFLSSLRELYVWYRSGTTDSVLISLELLALLTEWLQDHVLKIDKVCGRHLNARGVT